MKYGFIGCGNMGGAIAKAVSSKCADLAVTDRSGKAKSLGLPYVSAEEICSKADRIFLAVKPQMMPGVLETLKPILQEKKPLLITMAAGLTMEKIDVLADWLSDMETCGLLDPLDEKLIDAASALSGSGPAYMYVFLEALADGAVACGIPRAKAYEYAAMTMAGSAQMFLQTKQHPGVLKDAVCSPGGSTIAGIKALEDGGFRAAAMNCVIATCNRNKELGK